MTDAETPGGGQVSIVCSPELLLRVREEQLGEEITRLRAALDEAWRQNAALTAAYLESRRSDQAASPPKTPAP